MKIYLPLLFLVLSGVLFGQSNAEALRKELHKGKWCFEFDKRMMQLELGDTVTFAKGQRNEYPLKFKRNKTFKRITKRKNYSCGTFGHLESMYTLKWSHQGQWSLQHDSDLGTVLMFGGYTLQCINPDAMTFVISSIPGEDN